MTLWDPEVLDRIHHLHLVARQVVDGHLHGQQKALRTGTDVEFADYVEYTPGAPLKSLDWRVLGRLDRYVIRRYQAESELACTLIIDASADLGTGETGRYERPPLEGSKFGYAITLAATLAWFFHRQQEPVGLYVMGGTGEGVRVIPPRAGRSHMGLIFGILADLRPGGIADIGTALE